MEEKRVSAYKLNKDWHLTTRSRLITLAGALDSIIAISMSRSLT